MSTPDGKWMYKVTMLPRGAAGDIFSAFFANEPSGDELETAIRRSMTTVRPEDCRDGKDFQARQRAADARLDDYRRRKDELGEECLALMTEVDIPDVMNLCALATAVERDGPGFITVEALWLNNNIE